MSKIKVGIVDCRISNIASVVNALNHIMVDFSIIETGIDLKDMTHIILPGVGTSKRGMENLKSMTSSAQFKKLLMKANRYWVCALYAVTGRSRR